LQDFLNEFQSTMTGITLPNEIRTLPERFTESDYPFKNYLILANTHPETLFFCINAEIPLPTDNFHITSNGMYHGQTIGLELIYKQPIPSFLMNSVIGSLTSPESPAEVAPVSQR